MTNRLGFVVGESPVHALDFWEPVIDGRPLRSVLTDAPGDELADWIVGDYVSVLTHSLPVGLPPGVLVLLGDRPGDLASGRVPIYVCPVCGDLGCGALTAEVVWTPTTVIWRDFGWEDDSETDVDQDIVFAGPLVFDRDQYEAELRLFVETFDQVRERLPAHLHPAARDTAARASLAQRRWWPFRRTR